MKLLLKGIPTVLVLLVLAVHLITVNSKGYKYNLPLAFVTPSTSITRRVTAAHEDLPSQRSGQQQQQHHQHQYLSTVLSLSQSLAPNTTITADPSVTPRKKPSTSFVDMTTDRDEALNVYDAWAQKYETDIRNWGYDMPERVAALLPKYLPPENQQATTALLDTGCGDGLSGLALKAAGYENVFGSDLSPEMLKVAEQRKCYVQTDVVDLSLPTEEQPLLPYETDSFDAVTCIGTLTYVNPTVKTLAEFVRVTKPGGFICYTHRTDKADLWKAAEEELEASSQWERVKVIGPWPYLPKNPDYADKVQVMIYLFRVTK